MKSTELRNKTDEELRSSLLDLMRERVDLRIKESTRQTVAVGEAKKVRRTIARIKTILQERQREESAV